MVRGFDLGGNVTENVVALRKALGSVAKPLSFADFAALLVQHGHPRKTLNASTVYDWTKGAEPDIASILIMSQLAGVSFEHFALGRVYRSEDAITGDAEIVEGPARGESAVDNRPAHIRLAEAGGVDYLGKHTEKRPDIAKPKEKRRKASGGDDDVTPIQRKPRGGKKRV